MLFTNYLNDSDLKAAPMRRTPVWIWFQTGIPFPLTFMERQNPQQRPTILHKRPHSWAVYKFLISSSSQFHNRSPTPGLQASAGHLPARAHGMKNCKAAVSPERNQRMGRERTNFSVMVDGLGHCSSPQLGERPIRDGVQQDETLKTRYRKLLQPMPQRKKGRTRTKNACANDGAWR